MYGWLVVAGAGLGLIIAVGLAVALVRWQSRRRVVGWADPAEGHRVAEEIDEQIRRGRGYR